MRKGEWSEEGDGGKKGEKRKEKRGEMNIME